MSMVMLSLLMLLFNAATAATTDNNVVIQEDNSQQLKYIDYRQYLPVLPLHVYNKPSLPLPLNYPIPQHQYQNTVLAHQAPYIGPHATFLPQMDPASMVFIQKLMHPPASIPMATVLPQDIQFTVQKEATPQAKGTITERCRKYASTCLGIDLRYRDMMLRTARRIFSYARNPVLQPILLEEDGEVLPTTYGAPWYCLVFLFKCSTNLQVLSEIPNAVQQVICQLGGDLC